MPTSRSIFLALAALGATAACAKGDRATTDSSTAAATPAVTTTSSGGDADLREINRYELSMDKVDKYFSAFRNIGVALKGMTPAQRKAVDMDIGEGDIDAYARRLDAQPAISKAVKDAGLSTREFGVLTVAMLQASMATGVIDMRPKDDADSLARAMKTNPANIRFMKEHAAEIEAKRKQMEADMKAMGIKSDDDEG